MGRPLGAPPLGVAVKQFVIGQADLFQVAEIEPRAEMAELELHARVRLQVAVGEDRLKARALAFGETVDRDPRRLARVAQFSPGGFQAAVKALHAGDVERHEAVGLRACLGRRVRIALGGEIQAREAIQSLEQIVPGK